MTGIINFDSMNGETPEAFTASDTDSSRWTTEDHGEAKEARSFLDSLKDSYTGKELNNLMDMLNTVVDDAGHGLGDSRLFVKAAARAAKQFSQVLAKREGRRDDGQPQIKYNMPVSTPGERIMLQREAQSILEREFMQARNEFIRRSGRSLPGWWR